MQLAILAGWLATRLGDLTRNQPKSMLKIHGKPFLEYQFELLKGLFQEVEFLLYKEGEVEPYRWLPIWLDVKGKE